MKRINTVTSQALANYDVKAETSMALLKKERSRAKFDVNHFSATTYGEEMLKKWLAVQEELINDQFFAEDNFDLTKFQLRKRALLRSARFCQYRKKFFPNGEITDLEQDYFIRNDDLGNGSEEQVKKWGPDAMNYRIAGCFCMTELGHGSNVQGLETTAVFDEKTDSFIINTPTRNAAKWWIGGLAYAASISVVYCRLIVKGKDYGIYPFIVPLRSRDTHDVLPGRRIGDCGTKFGRNGIDNGWVIFKDVSIPREYLLNKWIKVSRDGRVEKSKLIQISYAPLIRARSLLVGSSSTYLQKAATIGVRYCCTRLQFSDPENKKQEQPIMNYATTKQRVMPILAAGWCFHMIQESLLNKCNRMMDMIRKPSSQIDFGEIADCHAVVAGLKAFATWRVTEALPTVRQCLGGHGYSAYSGIPDMIKDWAVMTTWDGDNTVMALQCARYVTKSFLRATKGKQVGDSVKFMSKAFKILGSKFDSQKGWLDTENRLLCCKYMAVKTTVEALQAMKTRLGTNGNNKLKAWNDSGVELKNCAEMFTYYYGIQILEEAISQKAKSCGDAEEVRVMKLLADVFVLDHIQKHSSQVLEQGFISAKDARELRQELLKSYDRLREVCVPVTDSFQFKNETLRSEIAPYKGDCMRQYFKRVQKGTDPSNDKAHYFEDVLKPFHKAGRDSGNPELRNW